MSDRFDGYLRRDDSWTRDKWPREKWPRFATEVPPEIAEELDALALVGQETGRRVTLVGRKDDGWMVSIPPEPGHLSSGGSWVSDWQLSYFEVEDAR